MFFGDPPAFLRGACVAAAHRRAHNHCVCLRVPRSTVAYVRTRTLESDLLFCPAFGEDSCARGLQPSNVLGGSREFFRPPDVRNHPL
jgi:hypothetical protein